MPETSISEEAREAFRRWAGTYLRDRGVAVELTAVVGRRWSALAGPDGDFPLAPSERIVLGDGLGLVLYGGEVLDAEEREALLRRVGEIVRSR